jgi:hypothetical protein
MLMMKQAIFALAILVIGLAAAPARADFAVVRFEDGWCRVWWDSGGTPWGVGWTKIAFGMPDWLAANAALASARAQGACR